jgi:hypothetical protein
MIGQCPKCGADVLEGEQDFFCRSSHCKFRIGGVVLGQVLHPSQVSKLLASKKTDLLTDFISKAGKKFSAYLVLGDDGKIAFDFPPREPAPETTPADHIPAKNLRERGECKLLINAATKDLFRNNAFRITGLAVDATAREIIKHADKLKMMAELGQEQSANRTAFALNPPPGLDEIRDAVQRIKDPEQRVINEFFWFWPEEFGQGQSDAAIQALAKGDSNTALKIWSEKETNQSDGIVAQHNLAIFWHLAALEWEHKSLNGESDDSERREIEGYWRGTFKYWERLAVDDNLWEKVNVRIRQIDDARLTTGFARRMRISLPEALDKINAELALVHAERGNTNLARLHIQFMRETNQGLDDVEKTSDLVLMPAKTRLREHIQQAKRASEENPSAADIAARNLIQHTKPLLQLFDLFHGQDSHTRNDLFDEVANACTNCAIDHQRKTGDNQTFVALLEQALLLAASDELKQRINKNIVIGKGNLDHKKLEPVYEKLRQIEKGSESPSIKFTRVRNEIIPHLAALIKTEGSSSETANELSNSIAIALRGISIDSHNDHSDTTTALEAIELAIQLAKEQELQKRVADDRKQLKDIKQGQEQNNLHLQIRNDEIEITREKVSYNGTTLRANDIDGVRFGIYIHTVNGIRSAYYSVGVLSTNAGAINFDCKKIFRSEEQARADFNAVVNSLFRQIVPGLCVRIAKGILSGADYTMGDCKLSAQGMHIPTGILFWKEANFVPYTEIKFNSHQGQLRVFSSKTPKITKSFPLRETWNAVIFEEIINAVVKLRGKS